MCVVLYGYKTWSLPLRKVHRPEIFENMALRKAIWPKNVDAIWDWRKIHKEELPDLYFFSNIIRLIT